MAITAALKSILNSSLVAVNSSFVKDNPVLVNVINCTSPAINLFILDAYLTHLNGLNMHQE